jgi:hypothetical protein
MEWLILMNYKQIRYPNVIDSDIIIQMFEVVI